MNGHRKTKHGIESGFVYGETPASEREELLARFRGDNVNVPDNEVRPHVQSRVHHFRNLGKGQLQKQPHLRYFSVPNRQFLACAVYQNFAYGVSGGRSNLASVLTGIGNLCQSC